MMPGLFILRFAIMQNYSYKNDSIVLFASIFT